MISVKKNYIWNTLYQICNVVVPLITAPYLARVLGAEGNGIYSYTNSIVCYFVMFAVLGTSLWGQRSIAYSRQNKQLLSKAFWEVAILRICTSLVVLLVYSLFVAFTNDYQKYYIIFAISILNVAFDITWFFQGMEEFKKIVTRNFLIRICHTFFIFVFVKDISDLSLYILSSAGFTIIGNLLMWTYLPRHLVKVGKIRPFSNMLEVFSMFLPTLASQIYVVLDRSMIGWVTSSNYQNGCYEQAEKITRTALTVIESLATVTAPRVASLFNAGDVDSAKRYVYKAYKFSFLLSFPMLFGLIGIIPVFVPVFLGPGYELVESILPILCVLFVTTSVTSITGYAFLISMGQQKVYTIAVSITAGINIGLNLILIPYYGAIGAAVSTAISEIVGALFQLNACFSKKLLSWKGIFSGIWKYILSGALMGVVIVNLCRVVSYNIGSLLLLLLSGCIVYFCFLLLFRDSLIYSIIKKLYKKIRAMTFNKV